MKRKLVQQGASTLMVSLPSKWVQLNSLSKGDEIDISEENQQLIISKGQKKAKEKDIVITLGDEPVQVYKGIISNLYKRGYDFITIRFSGNNNVSKVRQAIRNLLGYEIVDQSESSCVVKNLTETLDKEFDTLFRKSLQMFNLMLRYIHEDFVSGKLQHVSEVNELCDNIDKFSNFCRRIINEQKIDAELATSYYLIIVRVNTMAKRIRFTYSSLKVAKIDSKVIGLMDEFCRMNELYLSIFYKEKIESIDKMAEFRNSIRNSCDKYLMDNKGINAVIVATISEVCDICYTNVGPLVSIKS
jgi:phosphate uptake regulator